MIFELNPKKDKFIDDAYKKAIKEFNDFFGFDWDHGRPQIFIIKDRKMFDQVLDTKTEDWVTGGAKEGIIYMLDRKNYEKESCHKYNPEEYLCTVKHELCHQFFGVVSKENDEPLWLNEGLCFYIAGQLKWAEPPKKFKHFLKFYSHTAGEMYWESGFAVKLLIEKFGKEKILKLIKGLRTTSNEKQFKQLFKKVYRFNLTYTEINKLWGKK